MSRPKFTPVGIARVTHPHWVRGTSNQGRNMIFGVDPVDGSPKLVCEVYGYSQKEIDANIDFILSAARDKFWSKTP